ncbi:type II toxin-antitoxin system RelE/ParE family toxin [Tardiphaga sp.]|jgi:plasmid stabilization system protein ParE|uniref:type II toxin-antitoxin system RelE/ParE family toxin n=1 Tax=Tardiphaga sp. TaxID=1926292 RepID=UPI0037D9A56B
MKLRWSQTARIELDNIFVYLKSHSPSAAKSVAIRIIQRARLLTSFPFSGHPTVTPGVRRVSIVSYPYVVLYMIDHVNDEVIIPNVRHTARKKPAADDPRAG